MQIVILSLKQYIYNRHHQHHKNKIKPLMQRKGYQPKRNGQLEKHINGGNQYMRHPQLICHQLVNMFTVRFPYIFMQQNAVNDSQHAVNAIYTEE